MVLKQVTFCDRCTHEGQTYQVVLPGAENAIEIDLCERHAKPLLHTVEGGRETRLPRARRKTFQITPLNDAEAG